MAAAAPAAANCAPVPPSRTLAVRHTPQPPSCLKLWLDRHTLLRCAPPPACKLCRRHQQPLPCRWRCCATPPRWPPRVGGDRRLGVQIRRLAGRPGPGGAERCGPWCMLAAVAQQRRLAGPCPEKHNCNSPPPSLNPPPHAQWWSSAAAPAPGSPAPTPPPATAAPSATATPSRRADGWRGRQHRSALGRPPTGPAVGVDARLLHSHLALQLSAPPQRAACPSRQPTYLPPAASPPTPPCPPARSARCTRWPTPCWSPALATSTTSAGPRTCR